MMERVAEMAGLRVNVVWALAGLLAALLVGTGVRIVMQRGSSPEQRKSASDSLKTWWTLFVVFAVVVLAGRLAGVLLFAAVSLIGLNEFLTHTATRAGHHMARRAAYLSVPLVYTLVWLEWLEVFWIGMPLYVGLWLPARTVLSGRTAGFLHDVGVICWGVLLLVFCLSHAAWLLMLEAINPVGGGAGWFLYLIVLTQINDIAQALWGRRFGKHPVTPRVSPHKTWEGLLLGAATTFVLAILAAPLLTPLTAEEPTRLARSIDIPWLRAALAGLIVSLGGFFGDVTMSAVKRDVGVKDSGTLLPGQGGILDRIDSLTFTAPLFFYYVYLMYGR